MWLILPLLTISHDWIIRVERSGMGLWSLHHHSILSLRNSVIEKQWAIFMSDKIMVPLNSVGVRYSPIGLSWEFRGHLGHKRSEDGISLDHMIPMMPCFSPMGSKIHSAGSVTLFRYWHESRDLLSWLSPHGIRNSRMIYQSTADLYIATLYNN